MTLEDAIQTVAARYPYASCLRIRNAALSYGFVIVDGTRFQGRWITNKHRTEKAAWIKAAKNLVETKI